MVSHEMCPQPLAGSEDGTWEQMFPSSVMQFLGLVYRSYPQDPVWRAPDLLQTLAIVTFPLGTQKVGQAAFLLQEEQALVSLSFTGEGPNSFSFPKVKTHFKQLGWNTE
jgi:hypothetical protein